MKNKEFENILEKFEMKNLKDFSINYLETDTSEKIFSSDEKILHPLHSLQKYTNIRF